MKNKSIFEIYNQLLDKYGYQNWWPLTGEFSKIEEVSIGAVLTQNTSWNNVEKAINNLIENKITSFEKILATKTEQLAKVIKPAGFYNQKTKTLKNIARFFYQKNSLKTQIEMNF